MLLALYTLVAVIFLFGITIFVHELGHFLVARWCGMVVDTFSIGFGHAIWKRQINGVTYKIGWIPFGGYVALPQMDPSSNAAETAERDTRKLPFVAPWKKILVALAGVIGNMLLAVLLAYLVFWIGKPSAPHERNCIVGFVETNSASYAAGLRMGDEIVAVDGEPVRNWDDLMMAGALRQKATLTVKSVSGGEKSVAVPTAKNWMGVQAIAGIGWMNLCSVASTVQGSSAEKAGLKRDDLIVAFNGEKMLSREHLMAVVNRNKDLEVPATIKRDGRLVEVMLKPQYDEKSKRALIGIMFNTMDVDYDTVAHPRPWSQIKSHTTATFRLLRALVTPKEAKAASQAVGGPLAIIIMFWVAVQKSLILAIWFTGLVNVNLAVLNLLPIPILDGGHVVFSTWEWLTRRPISAKFVNTLMNAFAALIIGVFVLLTYRDTTRWVLPLFPKKEKPAVTTVITNAVPSPVPASGK